MRQGLVKSGRHTSLLLHPPPKPWHLSTHRSQLKKNTAQSDGWKKKKKSGRGQKNLKIPLFIWILKQTRALVPEDEAIFDSFTISTIYGGGGGKKNNLSRAEKKNVRQKVAQRLRKARDDGFKCRVRPAIRKSAQYNLKAHPSASCPIKHGFVF